MFDLLNEMQLGGDRREKSSDLWLTCGWEWGSAWHGVLAVFVGACLFQRCRLGTTRTLATVAL